MIDLITEKECSWDYLKHCGKPVLIYGMGNGADKIIDILNSFNIEIKGVMASDDFVRYQNFRGFTVKKLADFDGDFVIVLAFGSSLPDVMNHIISISNKYDMIIPTVPVYGSGIYNDEFLIKHENEIKMVYSLLSDKSKKIYTDILNFIYSGKIKYLIQSQTDKDEIFIDFLSLDGNGCYIDLGAYRGDTIEEYLKYTNRIYEDIIALEPDSKTFKKLSEKFSDMYNVQLVNKAISSYDGTIQFENNGGRNSTVSKSGISIECTCIDTLSNNKNVAYIKMDVEGSEAEAIKGGINTIKRCKPKLNTALYHRLNDIFEIPLMIYDINPDYSFEIRHHPYIPCWDMNLYCK